MVFTQSFLLKGVVPASETTNFFKSTVLYSIREVLGAETCTIVHVVIPIKFIPWMSEEVTSVHKDRVISFSNITK